jgi:multidrug efflux pump subunit AcrA (membrane-fusion protein)
MKRLTRVIPLFAILVAAGCGADSHSENANTSAPPAKVSVATVHRDSTAGSHRIMGTVVGRNSAAVETKIQARVERIAVALGSRVRAGDLIAELDTREFEARVLQARVANEQASRDLERYGNLHSQKAATDQ